MIKYLSSIKIIIILSVYSRLLTAQIALVNIQGIANDTSFVYSNPVYNQSYFFDIQFNEDTSGILEMDTAFYTVHVYDADKKKLHQKIQNGCFYSSLYTPEVKFVDINFDNYADLAFVYDHDIYGEIIYSFWIYDKNLEEYVFNQDFSDICCSIELDESKKQIKSGSYDWASRTTFEWIYAALNNKPDLIEEIKSFYIEQSKKYYYKTEYYIIENGIIENGSYKLIKEDLEEVSKEEFLGK